MIVQQIWEQNEESMIRWDPNIPTVPWFNLNLNLRVANNVGVHMSSECQSIRAIALTEILMITNANSLLFHSAAHAHSFDSCVSLDSFENLKGVLITWSMTSFH